MDILRLTGEHLRILINNNYDSQEDFSFDYGLDLRTVNRYINEGIKKVATIQELAVFFNVNPTSFFEPIE